MAWDHASRVARSARIALAAPVMKTGARREGQGASLGGPITTSGYNTGLLQIVPVTVTGARRVTRAVRLAETATSTARRWAWSVRGSALVLLKNCLKADVGFLAVHSTRGDASREFLVVRRSHGRYRL